MGSPIDVRILFILRKESYPEEHAPEAMLVEDEWSREENGGEWFEKEKKKILEELGGDLIGHTVLTVELDQDQIRQLCLNEGVKVVGKIKES